LFSKAGTKHPLLPASHELLAQRSLLETRGVNLEVDDKGSLYKK